VLNATRETIYQALFVKLSQCYQFKTISRRYRLPNAVTQEQRPAMFLVEGNELVVQDFTGKPGETTLNVMLYVYTWAKGREDTGPPPISLLNPIVDAVVAVLTPDLVMLTQNLGLPGIVHHAWIEGEIGKRAGDFDGEGLLTIPIKILCPG